MKKQTVIAVICAAFAAGAALQAQEIPDLTIDGKAIHTHAFGSQGFSFSNNNNYLTMDTSNGSFAMTDFGFNVSTNLTDKFRVGAQFYDRNIGSLGKWRPQLDWAQGDYRFKDWLGVRAGKVKTAFGLYNDTQDMEFLHTWAIMPQSMYPLDLRSSTISHLGADVYGQVSLHKAGTLNYTAYAGRRSDDRFGGSYINAASTGVPLDYVHGSMYGVDVRWDTPLTGLTIGSSFMDEHENFKGTLTAFEAPIYGKTYPQYIPAGYAEYAFGKWHFSGEFRRNKEILQVNSFGQNSLSDSSDKELFAGVSYRVSKRLELGTYNSRFYVDRPTSSESAANHISDQTVSARIDLAKFWDLKVEEHFMNGYASLYSAHGFYLQDNPNGLKPSTDLFVLRTGVNF